MDNDIEIFRVRKSFYNIKSQKGAFFILENAIITAQKHKCNVYNNKKECVWEYRRKFLCLN